MRGAESSLDGIAARGAGGVHLTQGAVDKLIAPGLDQIIGNAAGAVYRGDA
jgi:hypothetical protein